MASCMSCGTGRSSVVRCVNFVSVDTEEKEQKPSKCGSMTFTSEYGFRVSLWWPTKCFKIHLNSLSKKTSA